jgi:hypothetical protein
MDIVGWHKAFKVQLDTLDTQSSLRLQPEVVDVFLNKAINKVIMDLYDQYEETQEMSDAISSQTIIVDCTYNKKPNHFANRWKVDLPSDYYHHLQSYAKIGCNVTCVDVYRDVVTTQTVYDNVTEQKGPFTGSRPVYKKDANGNQILDPSGNPIPEIDPVTGKDLIENYTYYVDVVKQVPRQVQVVDKVYVRTDCKGDKEGYVKTVKHFLDTESKVLGSPFERPDDTEIPMFFKDNGIYVYLPPTFDLMQFSLTYLKNPKQVSYKQYIANGSVPGGIGDSDIDEYLHERIINLAVIYALETYGSERTAAKVQIKDVT